LVDGSTLAGDTQVAGKDQVQFEDDDLDGIDDFDDELESDGSNGDSLDIVEKIKPYEQSRVNARHEIEKRNELKALNSELDEWDELFDEDDL
jgi:hypothetical protein